MKFDWKWDAAWEVLPTLLEKFVTVTLLVTVLGTLIAAVLGLVFAIVLRETPRVIRALLAWILDFIRMTPLPVQLLFVFFASPANWSALTIGIVVIGVHYSTYMAESYRAGVESIPKGQWEATTALSMSRGRTWRAVIIPQALRATIPSLGNWAIAMFKDTPFLIVIYVVEMVNAAKQYGAEDFRYTEALTLAGLIFLAASYPTAVLMRRLEKKLAY